MSGPVNYDRVMHTTTTTGTGTLTLGGAIAGYQAVPAAADGKLLRVSVWAVDGSGVPTGDWETFVGVYTHSGTTLTRGTFKASSTGSAVSLAAGTKRVAISQLASSELSIIPGTDANTTMVAGGRYVVDMSAWATADRDYTLPTTAAIGDEIEVLVLVGDASHELVLKTGAGQTCAHGGSVIAASTEITRVFISGERMKFLYAATNKWLVSDDGRIPMQGYLRLTTAASGESAGTLSFPNNLSGVWTADIDVGSCCAIATGQIKLRRAAKVQICIVMRTSVANTDAKYVQIIAGSIDDAIWYCQQTLVGSVGTQRTEANVSSLATIALDEGVRFQWRSEVGSLGLSADAEVTGGTNAFSVVEVL